MCIFGRSGTSGTSGTSGKSGTSGLLLLSGQTDNGIITLNGLSPNATVEDNLKFDGTTLSIQGQVVISDGTPLNISTLKGSNTDGYNIWIGGGGRGAHTDNGISNNGSYNVAIGHRTLNSITTGLGNTVVGYISAHQNTSGCRNSVFGLNALPNNISGNNNTAVGYWALTTNTTGRHNTAIGGEALYHNTTGYYNTALGGFDMFSPDGNINTPEEITSDYQMTLLGFNATKNNINELHNSTAIGYNSRVDSSNQIVLGDVNVEEVKTSGVIKGKQFIVSLLNIAPSSSIDSGTVGEVRITDGYIFVCIAENAWKRAELSTW